MDSIVNWSQYNWVHSNPNKKEEQKAAHVEILKGIEKKHLKTLKK